MVLVGCESTGKQSVVRAAIGIWKHFLLNVRRCPFVYFPDSNNFWRNVSFFHSGSILCPLICNSWVVSGVNCEIVLGGASSKECL